MNPEPRFLDVQCCTPAGLHRLAYTEWGDADNPRVLICAHGLARVGRDFDDLARALSDHYRVVCPDMPGRGRSDWLPDPMLYQVPVYVADVVTLIARLQPQILHWFGTSMGGVIGMGLASLAGTPISRLILNDVGPVIAGAALQRIGQYLGQPIRFASEQEAEAYIRVVSAPFGPLTDAQWRQLTVTAIRPAGEAVGGGFVLHYDPAIAAPFRLAGKNGAYADQLMWDFYDKIACPTLAVRGALSDLLSRDTHAEMGRRGPHAELVEIAGVGHAPAFMSAEQIDIAREFLLRGNA